MRTFLSSTFSTSGNLSHNSNLPNHPRAFHIVPLNPLDFLLPQKQRPSSTLLVSTLKALVNMPTLSKTFYLVSVLALFQYPLVQSQANITLPTNSPPENIHPTTGAQTITSGIACINPLRVFSKPYVHDCVQAITKMPFNSTDTIFERGGHLPYTDRVGNCVFKVDVLTGYSLETSWLYLQTAATQLAFGCRDAAAIVNTGGTMTIGADGHFLLLSMTK